MIYEPWDKSLNQLKLISYCQIIGLQEYSFIGNNAFSNMVQDLF